MKNIEIYLKMYGWTEVKQDLGNVWIPPNSREFWPDELAEVKEKLFFSIGEAVDIQATLSQAANNILYDDGEPRIESDAIDVLDEFVDMVHQEVYEMAYDFAREKDSNTVRVLDAENAIIEWKTRIRDSM